MLTATELRRRTGLAEQAWAAGNCSHAFQSYLELLQDVVSSDPEITRFGYNEFLIVERFADLAVPTGHISTALDLYYALQVMKACPTEVRAMASAKRLQIAVDVGDSVAANDAMRWMSRELWGGELPQAQLLNKWEANLKWTPEERDTVLAQLYLALGRLYNALRRMDDSIQFLQRSLEKTLPSNQPPRLAAIPAHIAIANHQLSMGNLAACRQQLQMARALATTDASSRIYGIWIDGAESKLDLVLGRLAPALHALGKIEFVCRRQGLTRALCNSLLAQAEIFTLLNLLPETDECLAEAGALASAAGIHELQADATRIRFLRFARSRLFGSLGQGESVWMLQNGDESPNIPITPGDMNLRDDSVVWTGDCLRDHEWREAQVYSALDAAARKPAGAAASASLRESIDSLCEDFRSVNSPLLSARRLVLKGLAEKMEAELDLARRDLEEARRLFIQCGAQRELYQATLHLARATETTNPNRHKVLLAENDQRIRDLASGLSTEQRNAFELNKYTAAEEMRRVQIRQILASRHAWQNSPWWLRPWRHLSYRKDLHNFICSLDEERRLRMKYGQSPAATQGFGGLLKRLILHPSRNLTVAYLVLPDTTFLVSQRRLHLDCRSIEMGRNRIAAQVSELHHRLVSSTKQAYQQIAQTTCQGIGLQEILRTLPKRIDELTIIPDAELALIPFCALRIADENNRASYLVERFAVNLNEVTTRRVPFKRHPGGAALAAYYSGMTQRLECAAGAAANFHDWFKKFRAKPCPIITSKADCLAALSNASYFYYFGHGHFKSGEAERTGFEFALGESTELLSLEDLDQFNFSHMEQVVILACHGADATVLAGRWMISAPEMFIRRGVTSVLGAIWQPEQQIAKTLSDQFFERAVRTGRAQALRQIQLKLLADRSTSEPFQWAPFQIYGDAAKLSGRRSKLWRN